MLKGQRLGNGIGKSFGYLEYFLFETLLDLKYSIESKGMKNRIKN